MAEKAYLADTTPLVREKAGWLEEYARTFLRDEPGFDVNIRIKLDHSLRVLGEAVLFTRANPDAPVDHETVHLAALLHDAGRFPQYGRYGTFNDRISEDHAGLSVKTVLRERALGGLGNGARRALLGAVYLHNKKSLPEGLPVEIDWTVRAVRDSDKLDIMKVMLEHFQPEGPTNPVVTLGLADAPEKYSESLYGMVRSGNLAEYSGMVWINDFKLLLLSWAYDLNFSESCRAFLERGYVDRLMATLPDDRRLMELGVRVKADLDDRAGKRGLLVSS